MFSKICIHLMLVYEKQQSYKCRVYKKLVLTNHHFDNLKHQHLKARNVKIHRRVKQCVVDLT